MIDPRPEDEGRRVVYVVRRVPRHADVGVVTSWNDKYVFVRYGGDVGSKATRREDLHWEEETVNE